jgi:hypothetical protein
MKEVLDPCLADGFWPMDCIYGISSKAFEIDRVVKEKIVLV